MTLVEPVYPKALKLGKFLSTCIVTVDAVDVSPVTPTTKYVNIGAEPLNGLNVLFENNVNTIPVVTVPETLGLILTPESVKVVPDVSVELSTKKLGLIVYADVVNKVNPDVESPLKKPLGAALLKTLSMYDASKGIPYVEPDVESKKDRKSVV